MDINGFKRDNNTPPNKNILVGGIPIPLRIPLNPKNYICHPFFN
jgi:hypothetical protein